MYIYRYIIYTFKGTIYYKGVGGFVTRGHAEVHQPTGLKRPGPQQIRSPQDRTKRSPAASNGFRSADPGKGYGSYDR